MSVIASDSPGWVRKNIFLGKSNSEYFKSLFTPFNIITGLILAVGIPTAVWRFLVGLGPSTNPVSYTHLRAHET